MILSKLTEKSEHRKKRNRNICREFKRLSKQGFCATRSYEIIAEKYGLSAKMIQNVILKNK